MDVAVERNKDRPHVHGGDPNARKNPRQSHPETPGLRSEQGHEHAFESFTCLAKASKSFYTSIGGNLQWEMRHIVAVEAAEGLCYFNHDCAPLASFGVSTGLANQIFQFPLPSNHFDCLRLRLLQNKDDEKERYRDSDWEGERNLLERDAASLQSPFREISWTSTTCSQVAVSGG
ncbi:hypothetical protein Bca4012_014365 [Brassica carinata]